MNSARGVTLIELMVTVAIIVILAAVAYPAYTGYTAKARRGDVKTVLGEAAQWMQRYYSNNFRYTDAAGAIAALPTDLQTSPKGSTSQFYNITGALVGGDPQTFLLQATPTGSQAGDGILIIDNQGNKAWDRNNNGSFDANEQCWEKSCG